MSSEYVIAKWIEQHTAELRQEAQLDRLARLVRAGRPRPWWERLMLFRSRAAVSRSNSRLEAQPHTSQRPQSDPAPAQPAIAIGDVPC